LVIGADGVETMLGAGPDSTLAFPRADMASCAQDVLQGIDFNPDAIYLQSAMRLRPVAIAWDFPQSRGVANVGLGSSR